MAFQACREFQITLLPLFHSPKNEKLQMSLMRGRIKGGGQRPAALQDLQGFGSSTALSGGSRACPGVEWRQLPDHVTEVEIMGNKKEIQAKRNPKVRKFTALPVPAS